MDYILHIGIIQNHHINKYMSLSQLFGSVYYEIYVGLFVKFIYFCVYFIILHRIKSILYLIAYIIFCQRYTGVRLYILNLIIDD